MGECVGVVKWWAVGVVSRLAGNNPFEILCAEPNGKHHDVLGSGLHGYPRKKM